MRDRQGRPTSEAGSAVTRSPDVIQAAPSSSWKRRRHAAYAAQLAAAVPVSRYIRWDKRRAAKDGGSSRSCTYGALERMALRIGRPFDSGGCGCPDGEHSERARAAASCERSLTLLVQVYSDVDPRGAPTRAYDAAVRYALALRGACTLSGALTDTLGCPHPCPCSQRVGCLRLQAVCGGLGQGRRAPAVESQRHPRGLALVGRSRASPHAHLAQRHCRSHTAERQRG